jgi:hypothetical protein
MVNVLLLIFLIIWAAKVLFTDHLNGLFFKETGRFADHPVSLDWFLTGLPEIITGKF